MAIAIDYKLTYQDDLDNLETSSEYNFNRFWIKWLFAKKGTNFFIVFGLIYLIYGIIEYNDPDAIIIIITGIVALVFGFVFPLVFRPELAQSNSSRRNMQKQWSKKPKQEEYRNITITETEFIFKTEFSELAWKWQAFEKFFEGNKGFLIWFFLGDCLYIPKRIFSDREKLDSFKNTLKQHCNSAN